MVLHTRGRVGSRHFSEEALQSIRLEGFLHYGATNSPTCLMLSRELMSVELEGDGVDEVVLKVGFFNVVDDGFAAVGKTVEIRVCGVVPGGGKEMVA